MREAGKVTGQILRDLEGLMRPGVATIEIDRFVERAVKAAGMSAAEKGYCWISGQHMCFYQRRSSTWYTF